jgi:hypothetical protein
MPGNATIYIADPSLLMSSRFFTALEGFQSYKGINNGDALVGVRFTLDAGQVTMNFLPTEKMPQHLEELAAFAQNVIGDKELLPYVQARIHYVRLVCGCVITPDFDDDGKIEDFLFRFNRAVNGLLVGGDSIYDYDGELFGGLPAEEG